jgi:hypothetical protein
VHQKSRTALAVLATLLALEGAQARDTLRLSGTVDIHQTRVSFIASANGGGGVLHYRGHNYPFSIGGLGVGGIGVSRLEASGNVYNLTRRSQFSGVYSQLRNGVALGSEGSGSLWLKNGDGVVLKLRGASKGVALTIGADAVNISFK